MYNNFSHNRFLFRKEDHDVYTRYTNNYSLSGNAPSLEYVYAKIHQYSLSAPPESQYIGSVYKEIDDIVTLPDLP